MIIHLRYRHRGAREREFEIVGDRIYRADASELHPDFIRADSSYWCTGPATGYCLYSLTLYQDGQPVAKNGFVAKEAKDREYDELLKLGLVAFDLTFMRWRDKGTCCSVCLGQEWAAVMCGSLDRISPEDRVRWQNWLQPHFGQMGRAPVSADETLALISRLVDRYPELAAVPRIQSDLTGLTYLCEDCEGQLIACTLDAYSAEIESTRGDKYVEMRVTNGVWVSKVKQALAQ